MFATNQLDITIKSMSVCINTTCKQYVPCVGKLVNEELFYRCNMLIEFIN